MKLNIVHLVETNAQIDEMHMKSIMVWDFIEIACS
jgi:hypothetical protein